MFKKLIIILILFLLPKIVYAGGYDIFGFGLYDIKFDGSQTNEAVDIRYERRFDDSLVEIGPESENFFYLKPFIGLETTTDSALYVLGGIYLEDNLGTLFVGDDSNFIFTPSFGIGFYEDGEGKQLGNNIQFRTTFEFSYELKNKNRIGISFGHISNANLGDKNPGAEILSLSYQIPFD